MATGLVVMTAPTSSATAPVHKSYVCKYVSKPGEGETLQGGGNPIWVDNHSLLGFDGPVTVGQSFKDGQIRSVVIVANTPKLDPEPSVDLCDDAEPPGDQEVAVPDKPGTNDPCGPANIAFVLPADTAELDWTLLDNGNVTVAPKAGFKFEGSSQLVTFTLPADSNVPCPDVDKNVVAGQPGTNDPCDPGNIAFVVPADTAELDWTLLSNGNVTVAPKAGFKFEGSSQLLTFTLPADSGVACPTTVVTTPPAQPVPPVIAGEEEVDTPEVLGVEESRPKPVRKPQARPVVVRGGAAAAPAATVPTAVDAGFGLMPGVAPSNATQVGQSLAFGGLGLLLGAAWLMTGRRRGAGANEA